MKTMQQNSISRLAPDFIEAVGEVFIISLFKDVKRRPN